MLTMINRPTYYFDKRDIILIDGKQHIVTEIINSRLMTVTPYRWYHRITKYWM